MRLYDHLAIYFDGVSRNNHYGPAGCGWTLYEMDCNGALSKRVAHGGKYLGFNVSYNQAGYLGLIGALQYLDSQRIGCTRLDVRGDCTIVINQMEGVYNVTSPNIQHLYDQAKEFFERGGMQGINVGFEFYERVPRHMNSEADQLANDAIDYQCVGVWEF